VQTAHPAIRHGLILRAAFTFGGQKLYPDPRVNLSQGSTHQVDFRARLGYTECAPVGFERSKMMAQESVRLLIPFESLVDSIEVLH